MNGFEKHGVRRKINIRKNRTCEQKIERKREKERKKERERERETK